MDLSSQIQTALYQQGFEFNCKFEAAFGELTIICAAEHILDLLAVLKNYQGLKFDTLIDLCAVDYLLFGKSEWETNFVDGSSYSRGVEASSQQLHPDFPSRFAVVYHLLSTSVNQRCRVKVFLDETRPVIASATSLWNAANWFEREAYDLYGILFHGHDDLRRLLTDYGFIGHPFRKDFPLSGHVEMRYDATLQRVVYEPVEIEPRVLVPKVVREDNRYLGEKEGY